MENSEAGHAELYIRYKGTFDVMTNATAGSQAHVLASLALFMFSHVLRHFGSRLASQFDSVQ